MTGPGRYWTADEVNVVSRQALRWVIEHKACTGFDQCWMAAPAHIREEIIAAWGGDPWPLLVVPDTLEGEL